MRYLTFADLRAKLGGRARSSIYLDVEAGRLPAPTKLGGRLYWCEADVDACMRIAAPHIGTEDGGQEMVRSRVEEEPGRCMRRATAATARTMARGPAQHHETAEEYCNVVAHLCPRHRVILGKDQLQWILQRRDGDRCGLARWAGIGEFRTRKAILRASRALCAQIDPAALAALAALPDHFGSVGT